MKQVPFGEYGLTIDEAKNKNWIYYMASRNQATINQVIDCIQRAAKQGAASSWS